MQSNLTQGGANEQRAEQLAKDYQIPDTPAPTGSSERGCIEHDLRAEPLLPSFPTSSAAPPLAGLPVRDSEGEQRRGLHEEELPGDARLHETLQPAHHPRGRPHAEVRRCARAEWPCPAAPSAAANLLYIISTFGTRWNPNVL